MSTDANAQDAIQRLYKASARQPEIVEVPALNFLMIDGQGDPNTSQHYHEVLEALYALSYTLKFAIKAAEKVDYSVSALEGLWWSDEMEVFLTGARDRWRWTMMMRQPVVVTPAWFERAVVEVQRKKTLPALPHIRLESYHEGLAAQILHIGSYAAEAPTIARLHEFIRAEGGVLAKKHHEIYLGDPRRAAPEKLKTVIRQPFVRG